LQGGDKMKTRAQKDLELAAKLLTKVAEKYPEGHQVRKIYGGLCHSFPVLVRTCGLCQAVAFSEDKATVTGNAESERNKAHRLLLQHVAELINTQSDNLLSTIREADALQYMFYTRRILSAWIYFKRFAVSILKVKSAQEAQDDRRS
jgi:CRISPR-associated protein Cmr5